MGFWNHVAEALGSFGKNTEAQVKKGDYDHDRILARYAAGLPLTKRERRIAEYEAELDRRYQR